MEAIQPQSTPVFQKVGIISYFRRRRYYIRAWIQRRRLKPLLDWNLIQLYSLSWREPAYAVRL